MPLAPTMVGWSKTMGLREIKAKARADLHQQMGVRALYVPPEGTGEPIPCSVRVHTKFAQLGDQKGTNLNSAESEESIPRLVFWRDQVPQPERKGYVTISPTDTGTGKPEAYRIGVVLPPDNHTITARVAEMNDSQMTGLLFREDD